MEETANVKKILSRNIKKQREILGISQDTLAKNAGISTNMLKDIEGCRTWVSDKTLAKLALALNVDIFRLFISAKTNEDKVYKTVVNDLLEILRKIEKDVNKDISKAEKLWDLE